jgi:hypothetical protein
MKKIATIATTAALLGLIVASPASAHENENRKEDLKINSTSSISTSTATSTKARVKAQHISLLGKVTAVSGNTITVDGRNKSWTVNLTGSTTLYGLGIKKIALNQIQVGDKILVKGSIADKNSTIINAGVVQNLSAHVLKINLKGIVSNLNAAARSFTLTLANNKTVNVILTPDASFKLDEKSTSTATSSIANLQNGLVVSVSGIMNRNSTTTLTGSSVKISATTTLQAEDGHQKNEIKKLIEDNRGSFKSFLQRLFR